MGGTLTLCGLFERRVQVIDYLGEDVGRPLVAILVQNVQPQAPFPHGKLGHGRGFIATEDAQHSIPPSFRLVGGGGGGAAYMTCWSVTTLIVRCRSLAPFLDVPMDTLLRVLGAMTMENGEGLWATGSVCVEGRVDDCPFRHWPRRVRGQKAEREPEGCGKNGDGQITKQKGRNVAPRRPSLPTAELPPQPSPQPRPCRP